MELHDITLKDRMYLYSKALELCESGVMLVNKDFTIIYANSYVSKTSGYSNDDLVGKNIADFNSPHYDKSFYDKINTKILSGKKWEGDILGKKKNGEDLAERIIIHPLTNEDDNIMYFILIRKELNKKEKSTQKLLKIADEINRFVKKGNKHK